MEDVSEQVMTDVATSISFFTSNLYGRQVRTLQLGKAF